MSPQKQREIGFFNQNTEQNRDGDIREHKNNDLEGNNLWFLRWIKVSKRAFFAVSLLCFLTKSTCFNHFQYLQFSFRDYNSSADCLLVCYFLYLPLIGVVVSLLLISIVWSWIFHFIKYFPYLTCRIKN